MIKRMLDWSEKISAGSMLIGIFQGRLGAVLFGLATLGMIFVIQRRLRS